MRVVCGTTIRKTRAGETHGHIYDIDWDAQRVTRQIPVPMPKAERFLMRLGLNPRGGMRGVRGIRIEREGVYVANNDTVILYDHDWNVASVISHPLFDNLHEIEIVEDGIWVTSTGFDLVLKVDRSGTPVTVWSPRTCDFLKGVLGIEDAYHFPWPPRPLGSGYVNAYVPISFVIRRVAARLQVDEKRLHGAIEAEGGSLPERWLRWIYRKVPGLAPNHFHVNSVSHFEGEIHVTLPIHRWTSKAAVVRIEPTMKVELSGHPLGMPHNGQMIDQHRLMILDEHDQAVKVFSRDDHRLLRAYCVRDLGVTSPGWIRGLKQLAPDRVLFGIGARTDIFGNDEVTPTQIIELDTDTGSVVNRMVLSHDANTSIHGLDAAG